MHFEFERRPTWPPLAWLAECRSGEPGVRVVHGPRVETRKFWFCEAIWDDPFEDGNFDCTDIVFGSGARLRNDQLTFVSAGSTVDRLHVLERDGVLRVSNSLPCLLAAVGASADPRYPHYIRDFNSVILGLQKYTRTVPSTAGPVRLVYFRNLRWDGAQLAEIDKPWAGRRFRHFEEYRAFLADGIGACLANAREPCRSHPLEPIGTLSSGYDSPTVATLAREHGLREVITLGDARGGWAEEGTEIARILGLEPIVISRDSWREQPLAEVPFLAADGRGEDVFFSGAAAHLAGRVLLTGFHGDKIWDKHTAPEALTPHIKRGDQSGTTLSEFRLWCGCIHFPVPFMGVRAIADVHAISNSPQMGPWDVELMFKGYSRPICRRIVESAGVPRSAFGVRKMAASVLFNGDDRLYLPSTYADHRQWSRAAREAWVAKRIPPHVVDRSLEAAVRFYSLCVNGSLVAARWCGKVWAAPFDWYERRVIKHRWRIPELFRMKLMYRTIFPWAIDRAKARYAAVEAHGDIAARKNSAVQGDATVQEEVADAPAARSGQSAGISAGMR